MPEARVFIAAGPVDVPDVALLTDEEGRFRLHAPAPGVYDVACHAEGFAPAVLRVEAPAAGGQVPLEFRLMPAP